MSEERVNTTLCIALVFLILAASFMFTGIYYDQKNKSKKRQLRDAEIRMDDEKYLKEDAEYLRNKRYLDAESERLIRSISEREVRINENYKKQAKLDAEIEKNTKLLQESIKKYR